MVLSTRTESKKKNLREKRTDTNQAIRQNNNQLLKHVTTTTTTTSKHSSAATTKIIGRKTQTRKLKEKK